MDRRRWRKEDPLHKRVLTARREPERLDVLSDTSAAGGGGGRSMRRR